MADQGQWFKLWCSALDDPDLEALSMEDFGRWAKLGALVKKHGTDGELLLRPPSRLFCALFHVADFDALMATFHRLPGVCVRREKEAVSNGTAHDVTFSVSFHNWSKYQGDYSTARVRAWRAKKAEMKRTRGEERRGDEKRGEETVSAPPPIQGGSDRPEETDPRQGAGPARPRFRPSPKPLSRPRGRIRFGRQTVAIPGAVRPVVDAWRAAFRTRFRREAEDPKPWDLDAAAALVERHGVEFVVRMVEGGLRVGTKRMRDGERWSLQAIQDEWNVLVAMHAKGELA